MEKSKDIERREIYMKLEKCIAELTPEEVEDVMNYVLALKARHIQEFSNNPLCSDQQ